MKKALVICSFFACGLFIISSYQSEETGITVTDKEINTSKSKRSLKHHHKHSHSHKSSRSIASVAPSSTQTMDDQKTEQNREFGRVKKELTKVDIEVINKVKSNIPALADSEFEIVKRLKISNKSIYVVNRTFNGLPQSFTALVDNKSGKIEKSWGKTKYELPQTTRHYPATTY